MFTTESTPIWKIQDQKADNRKIAWLHVKRKFSIHDCNALEKTFHRIADLIDDQNYDAAAVLAQGKNSGILFHYLIREQDCFESWIYEIKCLLGFYGCEKTQNSERVALKLLKYRNAEMHERALNGSVEEISELRYCYEHEVLTAFLPKSELNHMYGDDTLFFYVQALKEPLNKNYIENRF